MRERIEKSEVEQDGQGWQVLVSSKNRKNQHLVYYKSKELANRVADESIGKLAPFAGGAAYFLS